MNMTTKKRSLVAAFALAAIGLCSGAVLSATALLPGGDRMPDGTVNAGISPDTHKSFSTTPADAPGLYTWDEAGNYCSALDAFGHKDWRPPSKDELNVEFNNRTTIGGFNKTGSDPAGWYWSFSPDAYIQQRFSDGIQSFVYGDDSASLRCVR